MLLLAIFDKLKLKEALEIVKSYMDAELDADAQTMAYFNKVFSNWSV